MKTLALTCMVMAAALTGAQPHLKTNLQACYSLDCTSAGLITNDAVTGSVLDGTVHGNVTCTEGHLGHPSTALQFGGTYTDYVAIPHNPLLLPTTSITIAGWFYITNSSDYQTLVFAKNDCASTQPAYSTSTDNGKFGITKYPGSCSSGTMVNSSTTSKNTWHYVVAYADNSRLSISVDNGPPATITHTLGFNYDPSALVILGGTTLFTNFPFNGKMDNLRFYDRELTSNEIAKLYSLHPLCTDEGLPPVSDFVISNSNICETDFITYTDQSANTPIAWNWQFEGGSPSTSTLNTPTVSYNAPGEYTVSLLTTNDYGSGTTVVKTITVTTCVGVNSNVHQPQRPVIFPNPAAGRFTLNHAANCELRISDLSGRLIDVVNTEIDSAEIDCSNQPPGVYTVAVKHRLTGAVTVLKLVLCGQP